MRRTYMLSTISDYKPINGQDIHAEQKINDITAAVQVRDKTYIRGELISVEMQILSKDTSNDDEENHFKTEELDHSYLLTFREGNELKTYSFFAKPTEIGHNYYYTIQDNKMKSCHYSEKGLINYIDNKENFLYPFSLMALSMILVIILIATSTISISDGLFISIFPLFLTGILFFLKNRAKKEATSTLKKLKKDK